MEISEALDYVKSAPNSEAEEKEMSISFTKACEKASVYTSIASMTKRLLKHTDADVQYVFIHNTDDGSWYEEPLSEFDGENEIIFGCKAKVPIESLKIQKNPRSARSYAQIISTQTDVNFDSE